MKAISVHPRRFGLPGLTLVLALAVLAPQVVGAYAPFPGIARDRCLLGSDLSGQECIVSVKPAGLVTAQRFGIDGNDNFTYGLYGCSYHLWQDPHPPLENQGEVLVGYWNYYDPGTNPFPCWHKDDVSYRGAVQFNLLSVPTARLLRAQLTYHVRQTKVGTNPNNVHDDPAQYAARQLDIATTDWSRLSGHTDDPIQSEPGYTLLTRGSPVVTLDVTMAVRHWLLSPASNDGLVFIGADEGLRENSDVLLSILGDFSLELTYF
jgi:hypothetical protein